MINRQAIWTHLILFSIFVFFTMVSLSFFTIIMVREVVSPAIDPKLFDSILTVRSVQTFSLFLLQLVLSRILWKLNKEQKENELKFIRTLSLESSADLRASDHVKSQVS